MRKEISKQGQNIVNQVTCDATCRHGGKCRRAVAFEINEVQYCKQHFDKAWGVDVTTVKKKSERKVSKYTPEENKQIAAVIKLFSVVNPSYSNFFAQAGQRNAAHRLLKLMPIKEIAAIVSLLPKINSDKFAKGKSISPYELEKNLGWVQASIQSSNSHKILEL